MSTALAATTFAALGEPSRLRIVELLRQGPRSVSAIAEALEIRQPQVSKHLRVLSESGIVAANPVRRQRIYGLQPEPFDAIAVWTDSFERLWTVRLDALGELLGTLDESEHLDGHDQR